MCLLSKTRVAPVRATSLPRLELMAAVRLIEFVCSSIPHDRQAVRVYFWTNSHIGYIREAFIFNRVKEIHDTFPTALWSFTPSADNPADLLTRGLSTNKLKSSHLWTHGPDWLLTKSDWPTWSPTSVLHLQAEEDAEPEAASTKEPSVTDSHPGMLSVIDVSWYSSFHCTLAVTDYVLRWLHNVRKQQPGPLTSIELACAHRHLVKGIQNSEESAYMLKKQSKCPPLVRQLRLFLDDNQ